MVKTRIKYDMQFKKACSILVIVTGVWLIVFAGMLIAEGHGVDIDINPPVLVLLVGAQASAPLFVVGVMLLADSVVYLRRLEKNGFTIPYKKKEYDDDLAALERSVQVENRYAKDSSRAAALMFAGYVVFVILDVLYLHKWCAYGEGDSAKAVFTMLMLFHLIFPVMGMICFRQRDTAKYVDEVDVRNGKKARVSIMSALGYLVILSLIGAFSVATAHSTTKYIYKSRYGSYEKELGDFKTKADMTVTSENLHDGVWDDVITNTDAGENLSPQLSFDEVPGASYYVIYMVDESADHWVHWVAPEVRENSLPTGANLDDPSFRYIGPYPPAGSGKHEYTVYVYALKGDPGSSVEYEFNEPFLRGDYLYYDHLNIIERGDINTYGNVLSYGYLTGTWER